MTDRENLIELLLRGWSNSVITLADYLISNGVVVRDKGEWIPLKDMVKGDTIYHCSKCWTKTGKRRRKRYNFCPICGADLRGEQHD